MNKMNGVDVLIQNKKYTLCGYESDEYLQKIATYINNKYDELKVKNFFRTLDSDMKSILMQINIADDYYKLQGKLKDLENVNDSNCEELYNIKHDAIALQEKLDQANRQIEQLKSELHEAQKEIIRLEAERKDKKA